VPPSQPTLPPPNARSNVRSSLRLFRQREYPTLVRCRWRPKLHARSDGARRPCAPASAERRRPKPLRASAERRGTTWRTGDSLMLPARRETDVARPQPLTKLGELSRSEDHRSVASNVLSGGHDLEPNVLSRPAATHLAPHRLRRRRSVGARRFRVGLGGRSSGAMHARLQ
jgi:hypothetical protein